jgi:hypothetical protein
MEVVLDENIEARRQGSRLHGERGALVAHASLRRLLMTGASLVQALALIAMSVLGSAVIALVEFRSSATVRCRARRDAPKSHLNLPAQRTPL